MHPVGTYCFYKILCKYEYYDSPSTALGCGGVGGGRAGVVGVGALSLFLPFPGKDEKQKWTLIHIDNYIQLPLLFIISCGYNNNGILFFLQTNDISDHRNYRTQFILYWEYVFNIILKLVDLLFSYDDLMTGNIKAV